MIPETSVDNNFTRQYIPEDNSEHHTRRRENLKFHIEIIVVCTEHHTRTISTKCRVIYCLRTRNIQLPLSFIRTKYISIPYSFVAENIDTSMLVLLSNTNYCCICLQRENIAQRPAYTNHFKNISSVPKLHLFSRTEKKWAVNL
jgi:hypothetical protein